MTVEKAKALIIEHLKELNRILFSVDGITEDTMLSMYVSNTHSYALAFDKDDIENTDDYMLRLTVWNDGTIDYNSRKEKDND